MKRVNMAKQAKLKCMHCGYQYTTTDDPDLVERTCPKCRSNSVRLLKDENPGEK